MNNGSVMVSSIPICKDKLRALAAASIQGKRETSPGPERKNVHQINIDIPGSLVTLGSVYGSVNAAVDWYPGASRLQANADFVAACDPETITGLLDEIEMLRAQLAERDALLRDAMNSHGVLLMTDPPQDPWKTRRIAERIMEALSASAEKIEPVAPDQPNQ